MERFDAIVLGIGGVGSAALYHLARRGARVLGIDMVMPPHSFGSSHGHTRVIRQAYFEHSNYVPLLRESYREWRDLESRVSKQLFHQIGLVEIGPENGVVVPGVLRAAKEHGLNVEALSARAIRQRWPGLIVTDDLVGVFESTAGYLLVEDCVEAHLTAAQAAGAEIRIETAVNIDDTAWSLNGDEISVNLLNTVPVTAKRLIVSAGAWARQMLSDLALNLTILRKSLYWFKTGSQEYDVENGMPVYLFELPNGIFYGFPKLDELGVKVAEHTGGRVLSTPQFVDRSPDVEEQNRLMSFLSAHLPGVKKEVSRHATCLYTMSPDEHFIVDCHPKYSNIVFAAGLSGHGFKFVPVLGRVLADLALDGGTELPIDFLSLKRFASRYA